MTIKDLKGKTLTLKATCHYNIERDTDLIERISQNVDEDYEFTQSDLLEFIFGNDIVSITDFEDNMQLKIE